MKLINIERTTIVVIGRKMIWLIMAIKQKIDYKKKIHSNLRIYIYKFFNLRRDKHNLKELKKSDINS